jgi:predicted peptidase
MRESEVFVTAGDATLEKTGNLCYWLYLPPDWKQNDSSRKWPLILLLHGFGEKVPEDIRKKITLLDYAVQKEHRFVVVAPHLPNLTSNAWADNKDRIGSLLKLLLNDQERKLGIDPARIYLTGMSFGGCGAWNYAIYPPQGITWAAVAPFVGIGEPSQAATLKHTPVWAFWNQEDEHQALVRGSEQMMEALEKQKSPAVKTVWPVRGHNCWNKVFRDEVKDMNNDDIHLYDWFLSHEQKASL